MRNDMVKGNQEIVDGVLAVRDTIDDGVPIEFEDSGHEPAHAEGRPVPGEQE